MNAYGEECKACAAELVCPCCDLKQRETELAEQGFVSPEAFTTVLEFVRAQSKSIGLEVLRISLLDFPAVAERVRRFDLEGK